MKLGREDLTKGTQSLGAGIDHQAILEMQRRGHQFSESLLSSKSDTRILLAQMYVQHMTGNDRVIQWNRLVT